MPNDKLKKLAEVFQLLQNDTITPKELEGFLTYILKFIKESKENFEGISAKNLAQIKEALTYIREQHTDILLEVDARNASASQDFESKMAEVDRQIQELKSAMPSDGKDGVDGKDADEELIIDEVLKKIPAQEKETGDSIVEKINSLDADGEKIDASHIKNLPKTVEKMVAGGARFINQLQDVRLTSLANNDTLKWNSTTLQWENGVGGGGGTWGSITGTLSAQTDLQTALDAKLTANASITGATKTKITYDADGLVTAGADATTADISDSTNRRYVTDAQLVVIGNTSGTNTGDQTSVSGNAGTATALQTARNINGVAFDGTASITVPAAGSTLTDTVPLSKGGTGLTTITALSIWVANSANTLVGLTPGAGNSIRINAGGTAWEAYTPGSGGVPTQITVADESSDTTCFPLFVTAATGDLAPKTNAGLAFNSSTGVLTATGFAGALTGNVTGNVSGSSGSTTGNAATATALQTPRTIGGVSFDGTANITVATATGGFTVSGGALALGANDLTMTGSLGTTGARLTKGWFTDLQVTNAIAGSITGNAATVTNATLTTALTVDTGTVRLVGNAANTSVLTIGAGAVSVSGANTGDQTSVSGNAGTATALATPRAIYGNNFDGTAALTQVIASTYGGTGNGFTKFTGPTTSEKTFTLPNSSATLLYSGGALGTPSSGTLTNATGLPLTGLVSDTTTALGVGSINLGHATDTTLTRVSAGVIAVEGKTIANLSDAQTFAADISVPDEAYDATAWNGSLEVPTKNAVRDKFESLSSGGTKIYLSTTEVTFTNGNGGSGAGTEHTCFSTTIPAGTLGTNNGVKFKLFFDEAYADSATSSWTIRVKFGGTTQITLTSGNIANDIVNGMNGYLEGYILADGATNAQKITATCILFQKNIGEEQGDANTNMSKLSFASTPAAGVIDSTADQTLAISVQMTNNAANDAVLEWFLVEKIV